MGEAPTLPAAVMLARHIAECPRLLPEVSLKFLEFELIVCSSYNNVEQYMISFPVIDIITM